MATSHRIVIITLGWNGDGAEYLKTRFPAVDWSKLWHRADLVFRDREHLDYYGTDPRAQTQFRTLYPWHADLLTALGTKCLRIAHRQDCAHFIVCKSGHHRSVCFAELLVAWLFQRDRMAKIIVWHLDHGRRGGESCNLRALLSLSESDDEESFEGPIAGAVQIGVPNEILLHGLG